MPDTPEPPPVPPWSPFEQARLDHDEHVADHDGAVLDRAIAAVDHGKAQFALALGTSARASLTARRGWRANVAYILAGLLLLATGFVSGDATHPSRASAPTHVMVVMEENRGYANTLGTCSADPYLCSLASTYASATNWFAVRHPSLPNYIADTTGGTQGCTSDTCFSTITAPSLGGQLTAAGVPWTAYMESMPSACFTGPWAPPGSSGPSALYGEKHDPFVIEKDVLTNGCAQHVLPYPGASSLVSTLNGAGAPDYVFTTPNQQDDMHTGSVTKGDAWLKANVGPVLTSSWFTNFNSTVIVTMDEGTQTNCCGLAGGHIPTVVISNNAKGVGAYTSTGDAYGLLRTTEEAFGLPLLGAASSTSNGDLSSLFGSTVTPPTPTPTVTPTGTPTATPSPTATPTPSPTVGPSTVQCSGDITSKLQAAVNAGGTVTISSGTCSLSNHIVVKKAMTIEGAGQTSTFLVQHARVNILQILSPGVTIEGLNLDTRTYNPGVPVIPKDPSPGTIFSTQSNTSIINVDSEAGTGFGFRLTGPNPCQNHLVSGDVIENVVSTSSGSGGFTSADLDCQSHATVTNLTIHGVFLALYQSNNVTVNGLTYFPDNHPCQAPIYVTGPAANDVLENITGGGPVIAHGTRHGPVTNLTIINDTIANGC